MANFQALYEFIDRAVKNRKYPPNTALGLKAALKLFEPVLNEDELGSIEKFKENLEQIYHAVSSKNKEITASSLATYKSRIVKVVREYEQYGADPTKMNGWSLKPVIRQKKTESSSSKGNTAIFSDSEKEINTSANFVFDFVGGVKLVIPRNQKTSDAIADGELKNVRQALTQFANNFMAEPIGQSEGQE